MGGSVEIYCSRGDKLPVTTDTTTIIFAKSTNKRRADNWAECLLARRQASGLSAYTIHTTILERRPWFRRNRPVVKVPDPNLSSVYVHWLYTGKLPMQGENGSLPSSSDLIYLYNLGKALPDHDFMAALLEAIMTVFTPATPQGIGLAGFLHRANVIYRYTTRGSLPRRLVLQMWHTCGQRLWCGQLAKWHYPQWWAEDRFRKSRDLRDQMIDVHEELLWDIQDASDGFEGHGSDEKLLWTCEHHMSGADSPCKLR